MPINYKKYPPTWKTEIRPFILKRANYCCEHENCSFKDGQYVFRGNTGKKFNWYSSREEAVLECGEENVRETKVKVVLTIAHLDHNETDWDVPMDRLKAMCQLHHLRYDVEEKKIRRKNPDEYKYNWDFSFESIEDEIWMPVVGYEGLYEVSNKQRIRTLIELSLKRGNVFLGQFDHRKGYKVVSFWKNNRQRTFKVHRVVAEAFLPNPLNLPEVNHIDTDKTNNFLDNLEWSTSGDNQRHAYRMGLRSKMGGATNPKTSFSESQVLEIFNSADRSYDLATKYGVTVSCIRQIRSGYTWSYLTGKYKRKPK